VDYANANSAAQTFKTLTLSVNVDARVARQKKRQKQTEGKSKSMDATTGNAPGITALRISQFQCVRYTSVMDGNARFAIVDARKRFW
jgi:hypothetical protein